MYPISRKWLDQRFEFRHNYLNLQRMDQWQSYLRQFWINSHDSFVTAPSPKYLCSGKACNLKMQHGKHFTSSSNSFHNLSFEDKASSQEGWHVRIPYPNILVLVLVSLINVCVSIYVIVRARPDFAILLGLGLVDYK